MWFYIAIGGSVLLSLMAAIILVVRKFRQLALVDADSVPQERENRKKREIWRERMGRAAAARHVAFQERWQPRWQKLAQIFHAAYERVRRLERMVEHAAHKKTPQPTAEERQVEAKRAVADALRLAGEGIYAEAERRYVTAVSLDPMNIEAYRGLGDLYLEIRNFSQAKETFAFLVKLARKIGKAAGGGAAAPSALQADIAKDFVRLALACKALGDTAGAQAALEQAVSFEPSNPRLLDMLLEAYLAAGKRNLAELAFERLKQVNPDNQKLTALWERIEAAPQPEAKSAAGAVDEK